MPANSRQKNLSVYARAVFVSVITLTSLAHFAAASVQFELQLGNQKAAALFAKTLLAHTWVVTLLAAQMLVIVALYALYFAVVLMLGRERREPRHWAESGATLIVLSWLTLTWLMMRWHTQAFPQSVWVWVMEPFFEGPLPRVLDVLGAGFLGWRVLAVLTNAVGRCRHLVSALCLWLRTHATGAMAMVIATIGICVGAYGVRAGTGFAPSRNHEATMPGNVIVIGLDSLRADALLSAGPDDMPNLYALRQRAFVNRNVVSPLANTFPAWVTILTGQHPSVSGARTNHAPQATIDRAASIAWDFRRAGYRTIYATDETRFSHIVPEFGFDQVIGPQMGVTDFLLSQIGDQPLVNFFVQLPYAEYLLPALVGNRAFAQAYRPETFVRRVGRALGDADARPTFMAIHLCTAHWPFYVAKKNQAAEGSKSTAGSAAERDYRSMLSVLDLQLGQLLATLADSGFMDERTLIVALADHGEGLPDAATPLPEVVEYQTQVRVEQALGGHGTSLLDPDQWRVFVMFAGSGVAGQIATGESERLASLEDVAPALRRLSGVGPEGADRMAVRSSAAELAARPYVLLETGWRPPGFSTTNPDGRVALRIAESSYNIEFDGRVELKRAVYEDAIRGKDIGVTDGHFSLIALKTMGTDLLVAQDLARRQWDVYPINPLPGQTNERLPLMNYACREPEVRSRIEKWCSLKPAGSAGREISSRDDH